ncbi:hypothetical protein DCAR_0312056 [Daucus carota subsp. sativus]|uniref:Uncharacterized protein n=1 Tax=Daucus carota subsp. sativus TaxID=79200 RepID=A0AAF0WMU5_DAUCS|nr:hypothetical protein DCAR_0312056 [Daucus carota subsp. sativus]
MNSGSIIVPDNKKTRNYSDNFTCRYANPTRPYKLLKATSIHN